MDSNDARAPMPAPVGRHYMNKMFGAGLERARQADEDQAKRGGSVARISIEPREDGRGHRVVVERHAMVVRDGGDRDRSEHDFASPQDALQFLHDILHGSEPEERGEQSGQRAPRRPAGSQPARERGEDGGGDEDSWSAGAESPGIPGGFLERALRGD